MSSRDPALGNERLRQMPKAELHVHVEGTLEPGMAARNGEEGPPEYIRRALDVLGADRPRRQMPGGSRAYPQVAR